MGGEVQFPHQKKDRRQNRKNMTRLLEVRRRKNETDNNLRGKKMKMKVKAKVVLHWEG